MLLNNNVILSNLNEFQKQVYNILVKYFKYLIPNILDEKRSFVEEGVFVDYILYGKIKGNSISFSIRKDELYISTQYLDIYISSNEDSEEIRSLCKALLSGHYTVYLRYGKNGKFIEREIIFDGLSLKKYNTLQKKVLYSIFGTSILKEEAIRGGKWIQMEESLD